METKNSSSWISPQFVLGILIIVVGLLFLADNFGYFEARDLIHTYWPLILVAWGIAKVTQSPGSPGRIFGTILIFVGVMLQLDHLDVIYFRWNDWWPVVLIIVGVNFLRGSWFRARNKPAGITNVDDNGSESFMKHFVLMSGIKRTITSKEFRGGELTAIMGGLEIDLREAQIEGSEAVLDTFIVMGGIEIRVPLGWTVVVRAVPVMGGVDDKTYSPKEGEVKRLIITGNIVMGGIEVKN